MAAGLFLAALAALSVPVSFDRLVVVMMVGTDMWAYGHVGTDIDRSID